MPSAGEHGHSGTLMCHWGKQTQEAALRVSYKVKHVCNVWPSSPAPVYLPRETKADVHTETYTQTLTAALFIAAQAGNDPNALQRVTA